MIYDNLQNIELYKSLSDDIYEGLVFLKNADPEIAEGVYQITTRVKAIVSNYVTKRVNEYGYEAHKHVIDIQYVLNGEENVCFIPFVKMKEIKSYSEENDAAFYTSELKPQNMLIGNGYFVIFYPLEGHMPKLFVNEPMMVKKVVIKVEV